MRTRCPCITRANCCASTALCATQPRANGGCSTTKAPRSPANGPNSSRRCSAIARRCRRSIPAPWCTRRFSPRKGGSFACLEVSERVAVVEHRPAVLALDGQARAAFQLQADETAIGDEALAAALAHRTEAHFDARAVLRVVALDQADRVRIRRAPVGRDVEAVVAVEGVAPVNAEVHRRRGDVRRPEGRRRRRYAGDAVCEPDTRASLRHQRYSDLCCLCVVVVL